MSATIEKNFEISEAVVSVIGKDDDKTSFVNVSEESFTKLQEFLISLGFRQGSREQHTDDIIIDCSLRFTKEDSEIILSRCDHVSKGCDDDDITLLAAAFITRTRKKVISGKELDYKNSNRTNIEDIYTELCEKDPGIYCIPDLRVILKGRYHVPNKYPPMVSKKSPIRQKYERWCDLFYWEGGVFIKDIDGNYHALYPNDSKPDPVLWQMNMIPFGKHREIKAHRIYYKIKHLEISGPDRIYEAFNVLREHHGYRKVWEGVMANEI
jgi:hypothetical protein